MLQERGREEREEEEEERARTLPIVEGVGEGGRDASGAGGERATPGFTQAELQGDGGMEITEKRVAAAPAGKICGRTKRGGGAAGGLRTRGARRRWRELFGTLVVEWRMWGLSRATAAKQ